MRDVLDHEADSTSRPSQHNLVLEYLSHQCFPATARILAEGLPTASSSNTSNLTPQEPTASAHTPSGGVDAFPGPLKMIDTDVTMMSSSISDLASIIDPSIIASVTTPRTVSALDGMSASTVTPSMLGWGPQSAAGTVTEGNGNGKTKAWQDDEDVDMNVDEVQPASDRKRASTNEVAQRKSRAAWIGQIERRKGEHFPDSLDVDRVLADRSPHTGHLRVCASGQRSGIAYAQAISSAGWTCSDAISQTCSRIMEWGRRTSGRSLWKWTKTQAKVTGRASTKRRTGRASPVKTSMKKMTTNPHHGKRCM